MTGLTRRAALVATALLAASGARAQDDSRPRRLGVLMGGTEGDPEDVVALATFRDRLTLRGWRAGDTLAIETRWAAGDVGRARTFARELVGWQPDVLLAHTTRPTDALHALTGSIPIVFVLVSDPVGSGFVRSLSRPGGNLTGFVDMESSLGGKWIELVTDVLPDVQRVAILYNPLTAPYAAYYLGPFEVAAAAKRIDAVRAPVSDVSDIVRFLDGLAGGPRTSLVLMPDAWFDSPERRSSLTALTLSRGLPVIMPFRTWLGEGGLASYGIDNRDLFRGAAGYVDRILNGTAPADLPVQLPTHFELAVNLKTARSLDIVLPPTLIDRADAVIE